MCTHLSVPNISPLVCIISIYSKEYSKNFTSNLVSLIRKYWDKLTCVILILHRGCMKMKYVNTHIIIRPPYMNDPSVIFFLQYVDALGQDVDNRD